MLIASISIFCKNLTIGASSTSLACASAAACPASSSLNSNSKSSPARSERLCSDVLLIFSSSLVRTSYCTITNSIARFVWNLTWSKAELLVGSATASVSLLPFFAIGTMRCVCMSFWSTSFSGRMLSSIADRSNNG